MRPRIKGFASYGLKNKSACPPQVASYLTMCSVNVLIVRHMIQAPTVSADKYLVRSDYKINGLTRYSYIPAHAGGMGGLN